MKRATRVKKGRKASRQKKTISLNASAEEPKRRYVLLRNILKLGLYRPLKKPVTLRLDADVLAWFRTPGRGYQTRINRALRKVMEEEKKTSEE
jgi:uncharacterized protein (DUF4415 family)